MQAPQNLFELRYVPEKAGIYIVFWIKDGKPIPIPRILATCNRGVLYIGSSNKLRERLNALKISIEIARGKRRRKNYPHTFGPSLIYTRLIEKISDNELYVWFKPFEDYEDQYKHQEMLALHEYTRKYGEPPPLNLQVGREYFAIVGIGKFGKSRLAPELDPEIKEVLSLENTDKA
ncbi:MAG: hypothetical protein QXH55_05925 [Candidatus Korarchaeota archaeon]|nr:hypothetical protein [Thermoproteota archaeon]